MLGSFFIIHDFFCGETHSDGGYFEECGLHCGGDCSGVVGVYAGVGAVVDTSDEQVDGAVAELHCGEFYAVGRRAFDTEAAELSVDVNFVAGEGLFEGDAVTCSGAALGGSDDGDVADFDKLFVDSGQAGCEDSIVVCK